jgi:hypothetical protein
LKLHRPLMLDTFLCRLCHDLTYESCQKSHCYDWLYAHLGEGMTVRMGETYSAADVARIVSGMKRSHKPRWIRKRDRERIYEARIEARVRASVRERYLKLALLRER